MNGERSRRELDPEVALACRYSSPARRILIVSDSLGSPIHPRGIFHYTCNLIRALRTCGHEVCLLVQAGERSAIRRRDVSRGALTDLARQNARLGDIYHYLWNTEYMGQ